MAQTHKFESSNLSTSTNAVIPQSAEGFGLNPIQSWFESKWQYQNAPLSQLAEETSLDLVNVRVRISGGVPYGRLYLAA